MTKPKAIEGRGGEIALYRAKDGRTTLDVRLDQDTVWLTQRQMADLFQKDTDTVGLHIRNAYKEGELDRPATTEESSVVQSEGGRKVRRPITLYNLDVVISVGYRVRSQRGTEFRIWATQVLRDHILRGYTLNEKRLKSQVARLSELQGAVDVMGRILRAKSVTHEEAEGLLRVIADYSLALRLLDQYDHQQLKLHGTTEAERFIMTYEAARDAIARMAATMGQTAGSLFGREKDRGWKAPSARYTRHSRAMTSIRASRRKPRTCSILLSKIMPSWTATSALPPFCSYGSWTPTGYSTAMTGPNGWRITHSWP